MTDILEEFETKTRSIFEGYDKDLQELCKPNDNNEELDSSIIRSLLGYNTVNKALLSDNIEDAFRFIAHNIMRSMRNKAEIEKWEVVEISFFNDGKIWKNVSDFAGFELRLCCRYIKKKT